MGRSILALVVGFIAATAVIMIVEMLNSLIVRPPGPEIYNDSAKLREFMGSMPVTAYVVVLAGYILGSFAGGYIVSHMSKRESPGLTLPLIIAITLTTGAILNFFIFLPGQPMWFVILGILVFVPFTLLGHRFAYRN